MINIFSIIPCQENLSSQLIFMVKFICKLNCSSYSYSVSPRFGWYTITRGCEVEFPEWLGPEDAEF